MAPAETTIARIFMVFLYVEWATADVVRARTVPVRTYFRVEKARDFVVRAHGSAVKVYRYTVMELCNADSVC